MHPYNRLQDRAELEGGTWNALVEGQRSSGNRNLLQDVCQDIVGGQPGGFRLHTADDAVAKSGRDNFLHIGRQYVVTLVEKCHRFGQGQDVVIGPG